MEAESIADPRVFRDQTAGLLADEARHNLMRGVLHTLIWSPDVYPDYRLFVVAEGGSALAAATITDPYNLLVADAADDGAVALLATAIVEDGVSVPGIIGNIPTVDVFVGAWESITGVRPDLQMRQGVFALSRVESAGPTTGSARVAIPGDHDLILEWMTDFVHEAIPHETANEERFSQMIDRRLIGDTPGAYWLWALDGVPVSLSGHGMPTGSGIRIGPVYTPPEFRGNGYASALVAAESRWLLENDYNLCFLYTDLANPTSNAIYERIGYRQIAEAASYGLESSS
ncbi:MAG: GNAT family N-acetyltransferase [Actinomycetota bacterium]|nr:GNAT family N-acetyltransferase [Actinomycetota bacterium]